MRRSIDDTTTAYRFISQRRFLRDPQYFHLNFLDADFRLRAVARYAGSYLNSGHYFAVSPRACEAEARYYRMNTSEMVLLQVEAHFDDLKDLTDPSTMFAELRRWKLIPEEGWIHTGDLILALASPSRGGNHLTDTLGKAAHLEGWNGVTFPSARALSAASPLRTGETVRQTLETFPFSDEALQFPELLNCITRTLSNVVLFRGSYVATTVRRYRYRVDASWSEWLDNPCWSAAEADLDANLIPQEGCRVRWEKTISRSYLEFLESACVVGPSYNRHSLNDLLSDLPSAALPTRRLQFDLYVSMPLRSYRADTTEEIVKKEMCRRLNSLGPGVTVDRDRIEALAGDLDGLVGQLYSAPRVTIRTSEPVGPDETLWVQNADIGVQCVFPDYVGP